ncbi:hypothetical protein GCM10010967_26970 [Dyadobacter beijingensis]|uniref:Restriction endonuclease n=1 Tax=Dyadobacter beijingensis TaxID=365489 RepID=A0ABQ2HV16_9BACT|nr:hypothetical protein [Dyadobacter beijingensis]GGM92405.1 hypothetical protein GCM10010967_26970 [Dyadobacter beijingensis]
MEQIVLNNGTYIQISVSDEQKLFARQLVDHSIKHHHISNIWDKNEERLVQTRMMRFTGSLGEVVFADCYHLPRPARSFGATDGQDWGQDFLIRSDTEDFAVDIKSMKRRSGILARDYVLNIPSSQLHKPGSKTSHYFCISFHQSESDGTIASLIGFIDKHALENGELGQLFRAGTRRTRADGSAFTFHETTYEVLFSDIAPPVVTNSLRRIKGFRLCELK